ncbi:MAG: polynucleotide adenylyltransferase PcnB [Spirochaetaceae bacterium]|nr:polynucleotide adenylyltransferase PcnB [Spirochaetaceae bacterium]
MLYRYSANEKGKPVKKAVIYTKNEHSISAQKIDPDAMRVITHLRDNGYDAYIVGGAVRDLLVGKTPKDFDIVTDATPPKIKKIFRNSRIIGKRFRLVHVFFGPKIFEVSTFRSIADGTVGNKFGTMDEDVCRRDFSLNALYYDPIKEQIIDYVDGVRDIKKRRIEPVIPLNVIFKDDPVRMLRAVKYAAGTGFHLPHKLKRTICKSASLLGPVSPSRLTEELIKIINSGSAYNIISLAMQTDIYMHIQPAACSFMYENSKFERAYMSSLKELDALVIADNTARLGKKLSYLIYDFIASLTDWKKELEENPAPTELFLRTWTQCRNFVLPMNPPRVELEFAIRTCLKKLGVNTKIPKSAFSAKEQKKEKKTPQDKDKSSKKQKKPAGTKKAAKSSTKKKTQPSQMQISAVKASAL